MPSLVIVGAMIDKCRTCGIEGKWNGTSLLVIKGDTGFHTPPLYRHIEFHHPGGCDCKMRAAEKQRLAELTHTFNPHLSQPALVAEGV